MKKKKLTEKQKNKIDEDIANSVPSNRREALIQLAAKLRIEKRRREKEKRNATPSLKIINAMKFEQGIVMPFDTERTEKNTRKWRGRSAD